MKVLEFPLSRITIFFIAGIILANYNEQKIAVVCWLLAISVFIFIVCWFLANKNLFQKNYFGYATFLLSLVIGVFTQTIHLEKYSSSNYIHQIKNIESEYRLQIVLHEKLKSSMFFDRYIGIVKQTNDQLTSGKILINIRQDSLKNNFFIGENILVKTTIKNLNKTNNPFQFDYARHLENRSVLKQVFLDNENVIIGSAINKDIWYYTAALRDRILENLKKEGFRKKELNVVIALILGQQQDISQDVLHDYQMAGAVHVLSVSGLHVAYIMLFINFLLRPLSKNKKNELFKLIIILISLWGFAAIAGLAPSIVRSAAMFSILAIGKCSNRQSNVFHTLLISLLLILLFQPVFLFDVGFQLSYVSVFSILWIQPLLKNLWKTKNIIKKFFWDILTVSFAAQIGAFPLSIFYFHQFPGLFFITNLIILPSMGIIMGLGVFVVVLAAFGYVPHLTTVILENFIFFLNKSINIIASLEQFVIQDIPMNRAILISMYLAIISIIIWFKEPTFKKLLFAFVSIIVLQSCLLSTKFNTESQKEFIVFNSKKNSLIAIRTGNKVDVFRDEKEIENYSYTLKPYLIGNFCSVLSQKAIPNFLYFKKNKIQILDSSTKEISNYRPDIVILTQSPKINLDRFLEQNNPRVVIADATNFRNLTKKWEKSCQKKKILFHATVEKGFFRI